MAGSYASLHCHIIFSTKNRQPVLLDNMRGRLWDYMGGILRNHTCEPVIIGGAAEHAHVLTSIGREKGLASVVRDLKSNSSAWVHRTFPPLQHFAWQEGYAAFTLHVGLLERAKAYIRGQEEHHRKESFEDEYVAFLRRHGVEFDEQHLWG